MFRLTLYLNFGATFERIYYSIEDLQQEYSLMKESQNVIGYNIERF